MRSTLFAVALPVAGLAGAAVYLKKAPPPVRDFTVKGEIRVKPELKDKAERPNAVLFVVARDRAGIPFAVRRFVNPQFPQSFELSREDFLFPGRTVSEPVRLEASLSVRGQTGVPGPGDLEGRYPVGVEAGDGPVPIVIDRVPPAAPGGS